MLIRSNYRDTKKEQFKMRIIEEHEEYYLVQLLEEYQDKFQEKDSITELRKCLVGDENNLYSLVEEKQLNLFDFKFE